MKKIRILPLILLLCLLLSALAPGALALDDPALDARAAVLADLDTGQVFVSKNADAKMYPASLTKVMTVLLAVEAIENGTVSLYDEVTASADSTADMVEDGSTANIQPGETMTLENLLYCALVESANEACNIIAEYIGGSISAFVDMMNARAAELGCTGTHFANPHGLPDDNHYTTANDLYLITREAVSHDLFMEICNTVDYTVPATNMSEERHLSNTNGLINADSPYYKGYYYEYAKGVKTGHTSAAGYCLISTAEKDGVHLVAVVLGCTGVQNGDGTLTYNNFVDTINLYNWVFNNFSQQEILSSAELVAEVPVAMGADADSVTLRPKDVVTALLPNDADTSGFERQITIYSQQGGESLQAPVSAGEVLGEITVSKDGVVYGTTALVASTSVQLSKLQYMKSQVRNVMDLLWVKIAFWVLIIALVLYLLLVIRYRTLHKRHQREQRRVRQAQERQQEQKERTRIFANGDAEPAGQQAAASSRQTQPPAAVKAARPAAKPAPSDTPTVETFTPDGSLRRIQTEAERNQQKRDYFEEFFRQRDEEERRQQDDGADKK